MPEEDCQCASCRILVGPAVPYPSLSPTAAAAMVVGLEEVKKLLGEWLMNENNHVFQNSTLQEKTKAMIEALDRPG